MKLSIIIPVYRTEATLERCMKSIANQTFTDVEVILVDDGSPDKSGEMCDEWARKDSRVNVIHKQNGGLSDARNAGIEAAQGEYITFVDSDDFIALDTYEQVLPMMKDADIVEFPLFRHYGSTRQEEVRFKSQLYTDMKQYWLEAKAYLHSYTWNKIYTRRLFDHVRFPVGQVFEDVATLPALLAEANSIRTTDRGLYYYCANNQGITATAGGEQLGMLLDAHLNVAGHWCDEAYYMHMLNIQMDVAEKTGRSPIMPYQHISPLSGKLSTTQRIKALTQNIIGIKNICKLNQVIHKMRIRRS